jgi:ABC-type transport system involved in cytochrome c biogenesis permease component
MSGLRHAAAVFAKKASQAGAIADRVNPIVVKELRQAVRSKLVVAVLLIFLTVSVVTIGLFVMLDPDIATRSSAGAELFGILVTVLAVTCQLVVPLYTCIRFSRERNDNNVDLLFITTIRPGAIVRGKFWASMALTGLIFASCLPFLCLTYLLRGIDLPTIFLILAWTFINSALLCMFSVFLGSVRSGLFVQICLWLLVLAAGIIVPIMGMGFAVFRGRAGMGMRMSSPEDWAIMGTVVLAYLGLAGLFYVLGVACLSPASSNRSMPVRAYLTGMGIVVGVVVALWSLHDKSLTPMTIWTCVSVGFACVAMFIAVAEREDWTPRVRRYIPRNPLLRMAAWLFYTGSSGGMAWCVLIAGLSLGAAGVWAQYCGDTYSGGGSGLTETLSIMAGMFLYMLCYCLLAVLLRHFVFRRLPLFSMPLIVVGVMILAMFGPMLLAYFTMGDRWNVDPIPRGFMLFGPFCLFADRDIFGSGRQPHLDAYLLTVGISAVVLSLASLPWAMGQWKRFRPLEKIVVPSGGGLAV